MENKYVENIDYILAEISASINNGPKTIKTYMLKPECFKKILMRNQKTDVYANYYLFLEKILKYYNDYQKLKLKIENDKLQQIINAKEDKIDKLIKDTQLQSNKLDLQTNKIEQQTKEIEKQSIEIKELLKNSNKQLTEIEKTRQENEIINDKLNVVMEENDEMSNKIEVVNENITKVSKKLEIAVEDRVVKPCNNKKEEVFVVIHNKQNGIYYIMCRQRESINTAIKKYIKENVNSEVKHRIDNPNCKNLLIRIKEKLHKKNHIKFSNNSIKLIDINEETFIKKINKINNMKKEVIVDN